MNRIEARKNLFIGLGIVTLLVLTNACQKEEIVKPFATQVGQCSEFGGPVSEQDVIFLICRTKTEGGFVRIWMENGETYAIYLKNAVFTKDVPDSTFTTEQEAHAWVREMIHQGCTVEITYNEHTHLYEGWITVSASTASDSTSTFVYDDTLRSKWRCMGGGLTITVYMYNNHYKSSVVGYDDGILFVDGEDIPFERVGDTLYLLDVDHGFAIHHGGPAWYIDTVTPNKCIWEYIGYLPAIPIATHYTFNRI